MSKGFTVVFEGQRINLRVYRRYFYPIQQDYEGEKFIVYSDTRRETEINYNRSEAYGLDDPFNRIKLIRLAKALNSLQCKDTEMGLRECKVTICSSKELYEPEIEEIKYVPFDPKRLQPLDERIEKARKNIQWRQRLDKA